MSSDWSQKIEFLLYEGSGFKFGGWTEYNANKFVPGRGFEEGDPVYGWIWHFFDIIH